MGGVVDRVLTSPIERLFCTKLLKDIRVSVTADSDILELDKSIIYSL
jgi:hypothetical protein